MDAVVIDYPIEMLSNSAGTLVSHVVRDVADLKALANQNSAYLADESDRRQVVEPVGTGTHAGRARADAAVTPVTPGMMLDDLASLFDPDHPISVIGELDVTTFQTDPDQAQRSLYDPAAPIHFSWNIKPQAEGEQDIGVRLFLEGVPLNGTEPVRVPFYAATIHTTVSVPMFAYGTSIAVYSSIYAILTFVCGGLATWVVPRAYALLTERYASRKRQPPSRTPGAVAAANTTRPPPRRNRRR